MDCKYSNDNDRSKKFLELEFVALRKEILELKGRVSKILIAGISGVPIVMALGTKMQSDFVLMIAPFISLIAVIMIISEQNGIMRAGRYIRLHLEPMMRPDDEVGWEHFLEENKKHRKHEIGNKFAVLLIFILYYAFSAAIGYDHFKGVEKENLIRFFSIELSPDVLAAIYLLCFFAGIVYVICYYPYRSTWNQNKNE